jgi:hypothetical protein
MTEISTSAVASQSERATATADDTLTICAVSILAGIWTNVFHEGIGHGLTALLTGAKSGVLTTVAWSSAFDSPSSRGGWNAGEPHGGAGLMGGVALQHERTAVDAVLFAP